MIKGVCHVASIRLSDGELSGEKAVGGSNSRVKFCESLKVRESLGIEQIQNKMAQVRIFRIENLEVTDVIKSLDVNWGARRDLLIRKTKLIAPLSSNQGSYTRPHPTLPHFPSMEEQGSYT
jgi:hypothetical protein